MQALYDVPAPAKLNLFLHVVGRRADGYHLLESAFMLIDWFDTLHFECRPNGQISRHDLGVRLPADDLCTRAARLLQSSSGTHLGVHISVDKRIPSQAGMGGGSSDAASTLLALNRLWGLRLNTAQLMAIGLQLGADVPFFLFGSNAWVGGIGEQLQAIKLPSAEFLVVKPSQGLDTGRIFSHPDLKRDTKPATISSFAADAYSFGCNDLQAVAQTLCPDIDKALEWLRSQGLQGRMTGSGSAVFARNLHSLQASQSSSLFETRQCKNLDAHPLQGWAD
jgi:4-diphosphocytidyl-2-C-methyl-D-erythritol kinase